jgi:hypothetical protein
MDTKDIQNAADTFWNELKDKLPPIVAKANAEKFSPESLRIIEWVFENRIIRGTDWNFSPLTPDNRPIMFHIGAYIGEVVRQNIKGYKWNLENVREEEIELNLPERVNDKFPNEKVLFPMRFIGEQITRYEKGGIVQWGEQAGLEIGGLTKLPMAGFTTRR